ncbi:hypothetical protein LIA77_07060 [Sarocladium implicatum]|nr:hypothetical protein LIA77_07060 [Sarocladium implicatum]
MAILDYEYDPKALSPDVKRGVDFLYEAADRRAAMDAWVDCFTTDATIHKGDRSPVGSEAIKEFIMASWAPDISRVHDVKKVTVLETSPLKLQIDGGTTYQRKTGKEQAGTWTAKQTYREEDGMLKIQDYAIAFNMHKFE